MKLFPKTVAEAYLSSEEERKEGGNEGRGNSRCGRMDGWTTRWRTNEYLYLDNGCGWLYVFLYRVTMEVEEDGH